MNILVRNEQGSKKEKEKQSIKNITKDLVPSTHKCISDFESWTGRLTCGVKVMAPAYIYIY